MDIRGRWRSWRGCLALPSAVRRRGSDRSQTPSPAPCWAAGYDQYDGVALAYALHQTCTYSFSLHARKKPRGWTEWIRAINLSIPFGRSPREIDFLRTRAHPRWWWWWWWVVAAKPLAPFFRSVPTCYSPFRFHLRGLWMTDRSGESDSSWEFLLSDELFLSDSFFLLLFFFCFFD